MQTKGFKGGAAVRFQLRESNLSEIEWRRLWVEATRQAEIVVIVAAADVYVPSDRVERIFAVLQHGCSKAVSLATSLLAAVHTGLLEEDRKLIHRHSQAVPKEDRVAEY